MSLFYTKILLARSSLMAMRHSQAFVSQPLRFSKRFMPRQAFTNASWTGEPYWGTEVNPETNEVVAVEYRDAVYSYEAR